ncbi:hypothetical protein [Streptomyces sp. NPDC056061]|uniref:hypothetical protein n=1 Tax=Streptomyces sp. NPDC056061 TaxID=3345700 RepID=UPI0035DFB926
MSAGREVFTGRSRVFTGAPNAREVVRTGRVITVVTWLLTAAVVAVSMSTAAPFIDAHSEGYATGPLLAVAVDGCFILGLQSDSTLARFGVAAGAWATAFRWVTGLSTVWLNIGHAALSLDLVGVVVHLIPPLLLLLVAEAGPAWRRAMGGALADAAAQEQAAREQARQEAERAREREREAADLAGREQREWEREQAEQARLEREREREREHEAHLAREAAEREEARLAQEQTAREHQRAERERREREREQRDRQAAEQRQRQAAEQAAREQQRAEREQREWERERAELLAAGVPADKLSEDRARKVIRAAFETGQPVRTAAELTGWSVGWVSARYQEHRGGTGLVLEGAAS